MQFFKRKNINKKKRTPCVVPCVIFKGGGWRTVDQEKKNLKKNNLTPK